LRWWSFRDANCGYGHGFSVREVTEVVKRIAGVDFKVEVTPRRPGDPAQIVATYDAVRRKLGWTPQYDDLATIVAHALAWEKKLRRDHITGVSAVATDRLGRHTPVFDPRLAQR
jgi:UDP-glucose 4-epimerase